MRSVIYVRVIGKCIHNFGEETEMKEDHLEGLGVGGGTKVK